LLNPHDPVVSGALAMGVYEKEEISLFSRTIQPGMTVVDVGANLGAYSIVALDRLQGRGQLLAVEPARENFLLLQRNLEHNQRLSQKTKVHAARVALSNKSGVAVLHKNPANKGDNRLYSDGLLDGKEKVKTMTLDNLCGQKGIRSIDVLKIDVQGLEGEVLLGSRKILQASQPCYLFFEFWAEGLIKAKSEPPRILELIKSLGFNLYTYSRGSLSPIRVSTLVRQTLGRKYTNIYGVKRE
jgi:FkbM family methyltransferase